MTVKKRSTILYFNLVEKLLKLIIRGFLEGTKSMINNYVLCLWTKLSI